MEVPETECELVGYTECDSTKDSMPARDDKVTMIKFVIICPGCRGVLQRAGLRDSSDHSDGDEDAAGVCRPEEGDREVFA